MESGPLEALTALRPTPRSPRVLIIEDDAPIGYLMATILSMAGYDVVTALDGWTGLEALDETDLDLVLLDLRLPDSDGTEVLSRIRASKRTSTVPVLVVSAEISARYDDGGASLDAHGVLQKPFTDVDLLDHVARLTGGGASPASDLP
ncbi:MAG TPA: response regulator [Acidimicrobiales bacterium]|nr:response regulator [Acidimicrobiales bacterium]